MRHDHDKLVAAQPSQGIRAAQRLAHALRHAHQHLVAGAVAQRVVHALEVVQIDDEHGDLAPMQHCLLNGLGDAFAQQRSSRQTGQLVVRGHVVQVGHQLLPLGDVRCDRNEAADLALPVAHRSDCDMHRKRRAVVADVGPLALIDLAAGGLRGQQVEALQFRLDPGGRVVVPPAQFMGVVQADQSNLAHHVGALVAGQPFGRSVHRLNHAFGIGLDDAERSVLKDRVTEVGEAAVALFVGFDLSGVGGGNGHTVAQLGYPMAQPHLAAVVESN